jgi:hypothetical protein
MGYMADDVEGGQGASLPILPTLRELLISAAARAADHRDPMVTFRNCHALKPGLGLRARSLDLTGRRVRLDNWGRRETDAWTIRLLQLRHIRASGRLVPASFRQRRAGYTTGGAACRGATCGAVRPCAT